MNAAWKRLRPQVLRRIKPSRAATKRARAASDRLAKLALREAQRLNVTTRPTLVGSLAKDTHLKPKPDVDLFLLFTTDTSRERLEELGVEIGTRILTRPTLRYAEHPYVHGSFGGYEFDVVPAYDVKKATGRLSAVDRSPFHAAYVRKHLDATKRDEVRLLKRFLKGIGCYGAETATGGFSGYLAELLILRFGSLWSTTEAFAAPSPRSRLAAKGRPPSGLGGVFVFADPVDPERNAAAAVSADRYEAFLRACRAFVEAPTPSFFWPRAPRAETEPRLRAALKGTGIVGLEVPTPTVRPDAVGPHLKRLADKIERRLGREGFTIAAQIVEPMSARRQLLLWRHQPTLLPETREHRGPPAEDADNSRKFLEKWQGHEDAADIPQATDGRWRVTVRRRARSPKQVLAPRLAELLNGTDLPAGKRRSVRLANEEELLNDRAARLALTKLLLPKDPWDA